MFFYIVPKCCYFHPVLLKLQYYLLWSVAPKRGEVCASKFLQKAYLAE
jgi:hypothetical protein